MYNAGLTVALALALGVIAQSLARRLHLPGIVLLLATGVLFGPDLAGIIQPDALGSGLRVLVGFAVAVVLFEGGLSLDVKRLRREERAIRRLVTLGALITAAGGCVAARLFLGWEWRLAILFGTLVIVTGPTVVTPLLKRIKLEHSSATILEAEGVLVDAIGAITAAVTLEIAIRPSGLTFVRGVGHMITGLGLGVGFGLVGGVVMARLLRSRSIVAAGLHNIFTLSLVLALFQGANALLEESGIAAVTVAGLVIGNSRSKVSRELALFKEQLTVLLIGMLFVLLAADVRLAQVRALGWPALLTIAALVFVVRPLNVFVGTWGTELSWRQRALIAGIAPRGIIAAAVASFFAEELQRHGIAGGPALRALVFSVIAVTVLVTGGGGGLLARVLRLRRPSDNGWVLLGAGELARQLALALQHGGEEVVCIDSNPAACHAAEEAGLRVLFGNGLEERLFLRAEADTRAGALAITPNEEVNLLFLQKAKDVARLQRLYIALNNVKEGVTARMAHELGCEILFARGQQVGVWSDRLRRRAVANERWVWAGEEPCSAKGLATMAEELCIAIAAYTRGKARPVTDRTVFRPGDELLLVVAAERLEEVHACMQQAGWQALTPPVQRAMAKPRR